MDSFLKKARKLFSTVTSISFCLHVGTSPAFELERKQWLESSTRESILAEFTKLLLRGNANKGALFNSVEIASLKKAFATHSNSDNCWDKHSLESYLLTQMPDDKECRVLLTSCSSPLWALATHFAQWPFTTTPSETSGPTILTFPELVRALAFLSGRHSLAFSFWYSEDKGKIPKRTDALVLKHIFQAMATTRTLEQGSDLSLPDPAEATASSLQWDLLDLLNTIQPILDGLTDTLNHDELLPLAVQLSALAPREPSILTISPSGGLFQLLDLSISLLQHASKFDTTRTPVLLIKDLKTARINLQHIGWISYDSFTKSLDGDDANIYDAIALLFNTLTSPNSLRSGIMIDLRTKKKVDLYLRALRNPGSSPVSI